MTSDYGPKTAFGQQIFAEKYSFRGEDYRSMTNRVAATLSDGADHYHAVRELVGNQRFLFGGRILGGAGTSKSVCLHNCFVSGRIEDSYVDGPGSIMQRAHEAASTMRMGGGIGYDFSTLRPRGSLIKKLDSNATGPVSFMEIFNSVGLATCSSGHRRGAQMGVLRVDHPDIFEFVQAKQTPGRLTGFNISVGVTNEFMSAVEYDSDFPLRWGGEIYRTIKARELWELIMRAAWDWAEPGVLFLDRMNSENNLQYCETIEATNPCSEQPLPAYGACLLGSFNLAKFIRQDVLFPDSMYFDMEAFKRAIPDAVRSMDLVNDVAFYPLREQRVEALSKRRLGIGVMGLANAIEALGFPYGSPAFLSTADEILMVLKNEAYRASALLAAEKGAFPLYKPDYLEASFIQRLDSDVIDLIRRNGIRNSHLISMAPTGTIAQLCDNVSGGIEPTFKAAYTRDSIFPTGTVTTVVEDYGVIAFGNKPRCADEVSAEEHVAVLTCAQAHTDSAVSKTCNVTGEMEWDAFKDIYFQAWRRGAKGCTVFNKDGKRMGVLRDLPAVPADSSSAQCASGLCDV
jgi:ribonucleoside-diphosphate reductase alpha chain